ncbi:MAG: CoB--CoM heterodisulfide reductase iron-sulfur subunit A family protein [Deltaproteobacteria bacterium]|nr:CoB--CoM heterodisulfide reductase iron-sulfur subunit A family protein [Deltaproteobacteria bacterium]
MTDMNAFNTLQPAVLILGSGIAGLQAALDLDEFGVASIILEHEAEAGGLLNRLDKLFPTNDCADCVLSGRLEDVALRPRIRIVPNARLLSVSGEAGAFQATFAVAPPDGATVEETVRVGAVILATGCEAFDASLKPEWGYGRFPNVVTGLEFEQWMRPGRTRTRGLLRPSDEKAPRNIAFLQCVGSRDETCGRGYCSSVCCAFAVKEAISAHELAPDVKSTLFFMDVRAHDKGLDDYFEHARERHNLAFEYARVAAVEEVGGSGNLRLVCESEGGIYRDEEFDLVVLSVGLGPSEEAQRTARLLDVGLDRYGFCRTYDFSPVETSRRGIYVCGSFQGPKDVAESLVQASAAAAACVRDLGTPAATKFDVSTISREDPGVARIGVFVCHCGLNMGKVLDLREIAEAAGKLPGVVHAEEMMFACSDASRSQIRSRIESERLNRIVVAACSSRVLGRLFENSCIDAGLPARFVEMANLREQCAWVHQGAGNSAREKAVRQIIGAVTSVAHRTVSEGTAVACRDNALVVGGGVTGLYASLELCRLGVRTTLVEQSGEWGGNARRLVSSWSGQPVGSFIKDLVAQAGREELLELVRNTTVEEVRGRRGDFTSVLKDGSGRSRTMEHGVLLITTGAEETIPEEYKFGEHPSIMTHLEFDDLVRNENVELRDPNTLIFIQCVGSREPGRPYCSRVCCTHSIKSALAVKRVNPESRIFILYRDIRTYGLREDLYREAREKGVFFVRFHPERKPAVEIRDGRIQVTVRDELLKAELQIRADRLVLASAIQPVVSRFWEGVEGCEPDEYGFLKEASMPMSSVDLGVGGVYVAGMAQSPKSVDEAIVQAQAAAGRAVAWLRNFQRTRYSAVVNEDLCRVCLACVRVCPYGAPAAKERGKSHIDPVLCRACGVCVSECPAEAISMDSTSNKDLSAQISALLAS